MKLKSEKTRQRFIDDCILSYEQKENDFPVVNDLSEVKPGYRGLVMVINDHGNITIGNHFKNDNFREIASCV